VSNCGGSQSGSVTVVHSCLKCDDDECRCVNIVFLDSSNCDKSCLIVVAVVAIEVVVVVLVAFCLFVS
jgi:hypothetical protein